jgi:sugar transferase (PEP-CTERM/EpsH1 system associated)
MARRHEVDLFTLADQAEELAHQRALLEYCRQVTVARLNPRLARLRSLPYLLTRTPLTAPYFYSAELDREVRKALARRSYDRLFVYCSAMAQYVDTASQIPVLMDLVDVDSDKWTQYGSLARFPWSAVYRREGRYLREYEREACRRCAGVVVSTEREAELARKVAEGTAVHVVPNGVDSNYFSRPAMPRDSRPPAVVFTGDMSYFPNEVAAIYFARSVLPLIRRSQKDVRFLVVGRNPGRKVRELRGMTGVEVTGFVPDVREHLARAQVSVAPFSIAAGIPNKILEAMAYGLPVVATPRAVQGLSRSVAGAVETAESAEELAGRVVALLGDPERARRKGMEGRRRVIAEHNWEQVLDRLLELLEDPGGLRPRTASPRGGRDVGSQNASW